MNKNKNQKKFNHKNFKKFKISFWRLFVTRSSNRVTKKSTKIHLIVSFLIRSRFCVIFTIFSRSIFRAFVRRITIDVIFEMIIDVEKKIFNSKEFNNVFMQNTSKFIENEIRVTILQKKIIALKTKKVLQKKLTNLNVNDNKFRFFISLIFNFTNQLIVTFFIIMLSKNWIVDYFANFKFITLIKVYSMITFRLLLNIIQRKLNVKNISKFIFEFVAIDFKNVFEIKNIL